MKRALLTLIATCTYCALSYAQIYVPTGYPVTHGNGNGVGIGPNQTNPVGYLHVNTNLYNGALQIETHSGNAIGGGTATTPYAVRGYQTQTIYSPSTTTEVTLLNSRGVLSLGDFTGISTFSNDFLNVKTGMGWYNNNTNKLIFRITQAGFDFDWFTDVSNTAFYKYATNLNFRYNGSDPILSLTPSQQVLIGTDDYSSGYALCVGGGVLAEQLQIGNTLLPTGFNLSVDGKAIAEEVVVKLTSNWPDYVFTPSYTMLSNAQLRSYIAENGKLPYLPSAQDVIENGVALGETHTQLTRLVEELTLRLLEMEERIVELESQLAQE